MSDVENDATKAHEPGRKLKKLVFAALVSPAAVSVGLMVGSAQAHGNASSHKGLQLDWSYDNFVIKRETLVSPNAPMTEKLHALERERAATRAALEVTVRSVEQNLGASTRTRIQVLGETQVLAQSEEKSSKELRQLQDSLLLRPSTRAVLNFLAQNDQAGAISAIESAGTPEMVLIEYSLIQLDLMNYGVVGGYSTPTFLPEIIVITRAALTYQGTHTASDTRTAAGLLHNLASAAAPDRGNVTQEQFKIGSDAADRALKLRQQLGDPQAIGIAEYMVGVYQLRAKDFPGAEALFSSAAAKLRIGNNKEALAWNLLFLGYAQQAVGKSDAAANVELARKLFADLNNDYGIAYITAGVGRPN